VSTVLNRGTPAYLLIKPGERLPERQLGKMFNVNQVRRVIRTAHDGSKTAIDAARPA
jgi:hypothetical protein